MAGFRLQPVYGCAMQQAAEKGDLDEMKALAEQAEAVLASEGDIAGELKSLKAAIAKQEADEG
jgi:hypothetical protein